MREPLAIVRAGVFCPVGLDAEQAAASIMAGVPGKQETPFGSERGEPIVMGYLPEDVLPPLIAELEGARIGLAPLEARLLRLATPALQELLGGPYDAGVGDVGGSLATVLPHGLTAWPPLLVVGPEASPDETALVTEAFLERLVRQARVPLDLAASRSLPLGRAGLFTALQQARAWVSGSSGAEFVVVGGVDTYFDEQRLVALEDEGRLLTSGVQDAFTPGEGAAFLLLASRGACLRYGLDPLAWIVAVGTAAEPGHRYSDVPHRGEGLAAAFGQVFEEFGGRVEPVRSVMAGLNGESLHAKEWGIACVRHREGFTDSPRIEHPAEHTGDIGAALVPTMLAVAALELRSKRLEGPALVWAASDRAERGALLVRAT